MPNKLQRFSFAFIIYLIVCTGTILFIDPFSFVSFIGPVAGVTTALVIFMGVNVLFITAIAIIAFSGFLSWYTQLNIDLAMIVLAVLAIMLQSYLAKQIVSIELHQQNWLKSRKALFAFLFKIGPLTGLVCASTIVVITILDNEKMTGSLFYVFVSSWSGSILFAIFFTPLFLLAQQKQQLSASKRLFITLASFLAFITIGLLYKTSQNIQLRDRQDMFTQVKHEVKQTIEQEVERVVSEVNSLSAFISASDQVTLSEFTLFTEKTSHKSSSIKVLEWAPIIEHDQRESYETISMNPIMERSDTTKLQIAKVRKRYAPVHHAFSHAVNRVTLGFDVLTNSKDVISMAEVMNSNSIIASAPSNLSLGDYNNLGILFISSVHTKNKHDIQGFVVAVVQFNDFFSQLSKLTMNDVNLFIEDISSEESYILYGQQSTNRNNHVEQLTLDIFSRQWQISFSELQPWQMQQKSWQAWGILLGATLGGMLFQLLILMMVAYSSELSIQVRRKTQELIIAKELSEKESTAKTVFLKTLNKELQAPLKAINVFVEQLRETEQKQQKTIITNIDLSQKNMSHLLDMVTNLSKIESGELVVKSEVFDFHHFLMRIDEMLKAQNASKGRSMTLVIDPSVPHFISSDELRIQQFLLPLCASIYELYNVSSIRLTIKAHSHQFNMATLLFVFTDSDDEHTRKKIPIVNSIVRDISQCSTQMAMVKEICQLMQGDLSFGATKSDEKILTAAIKISQIINSQ